MVLFFRGCSRAQHIVGKIFAKDNGAKFGKKSLNAGDSLRTHFVRIGCVRGKGIKGIK
jgi:hypothetical protein